MGLLQVHRVIQCMCCDVIVPILPLAQGPSINLCIDRWEGLKP